MAVTITYFVHATTTDNENGLMTGWNPGELSELGVRQAKELSSQADPSSFSALFSSDLKRAMESTELGFAGLLPILYDWRLRECNYGEFNGAQDEAIEKISHIHDPYVDGESYVDVERRIRSFLADALREFDGQHIAIMGHQAPQLALEVVCEGKTWDEAFATDWRKTKQWRPGWKYVFSG